MIGDAVARFGAQHVFVSRTELFAHAQIGQKVVNQSGNSGDVGEGVDLILNQTERVPGDLQPRLEQAHQFAEFANARHALFENVQILLKRVAHLGRRLSGGLLFDARDFAAQSGFDVAVIASREQVMRPQHPRVIVAERREFFDDTGKQPRGARVSKLVRAPLDLVTQPPQRIIIVLVLAGQRFDDGRFGLLGLDPAVFVLTRPDDALDARMLRDEQSADLAGQKEWQEPPEINDEHQKKHHPYKRQIGIARQNLFCVIDLFVSHPIFRFFHYFQPRGHGDHGDKKKREMIPLFSSPWRPCSPWLFLHTQLKSDRGYSLGNSMSLISFRNSAKRGRSSMSGRYASPSAIRSYSFITLDPGTGSPFLSRSRPNK